MTGGHEGGAVLLTENPVDEIRITLTDLKQAVILQGMLQGHTGLKHVAAGIELVVVAIGETRLVHIGIVIIGIIVPVFLGALFDHVHQIVDQCQKFLIGMFFQNVGSAFHPLYHIAAPEHVGFHIVLLTVHGLDTAGFLETVIHRPHGFVDDGLLALLPETTGNINIIKRNLLHHLK